jgi:GTPase SAR1 family protein
MAMQGKSEQQPILLQSRDHSKLLDIIDLLRSQGVSHYVPLPQIIVCGDQSSGKSSVLEAVSGVRFPTKDNLCTRFATELILRRGVKANVAVGITPGNDRSDEEKATLARFKVPDARIEDFPSLIEAAKKAMGINAGTKAFSNDILKVEVTGPSQPHLTLVDLPGLIHAENKQQSSSDVELVSSLVQHYMASSRSIILAVVSAKNDYANQIVTKLARDVDPKGLRTLGVITKPDTLHIGSESEKAFVDLAKNEDVIFRLGWHILKNRDYANRDCSAEKRDEEERSFFSMGIWTNLPTNVLGLDPLKPRLSTVLRDQIITELSSLIHDVETGIDDCRNRLVILGEARGSLKEQRRYLMHVGQSFGSIVKAAVGGIYVHDFFGSAKTKEGYSKRLRAIIQALLIEFADNMRRRGHDREIVGERNTGVDENKSDASKIARADYVLEVRSLMRRSRGCELPGTFNPLIVGDLFFQQSLPWKSVIDEYCDKILEGTRLCIDLTLIHITDDRTRAGLHREIIDPALEDFSKALAKKVSELMKPYQKGHPITYNHYFTETVQKAREEHDRNELQRRLNDFFKLTPETAASNISQRSLNTADLLNALTKSTERDMELHACSEAIYCMEAYYKVRCLYGSASIEAYHHTVEWYI